MAPTAAAASAKAPEATNLTKTQRRRIERKKRKEREVEAIKSVVEASPPVKVPTTAASKAAATAVKTIKVNDQRLRKALLGRLQASKGASDGEAATPRAAQAAPAATATSLQQKMKDRLKGARFRWINEKLYTSSSEEAVQMFREDPSIFKEYHEGFRTQVALWPQNPVDSFIKELKRASKDLVVADLGCGEAAIAASVPQKVHSFDLVAHNERVVACDIAHVPLPNESVDIAIFSLSLMGTNYLDFLREAHRILKLDGRMQIAEVVSRFDNLDAFIQSVEASGFRLVKRDESNPMFARIDFRKASAKYHAPQAAPELKPCLYKKR